jgi:TolB protein
MEAQMSYRHRVPGIAALAGLFGIVAAVAGGSAVSSPAKNTTVPGKNGAIAFKRYLDRSRSTGAIFTITPNGQSSRQITRPEQGVIDDQPDWSADGARLVFHRASPDGPWAVYTVSADGSDLERVSPPCSASDTQCEDGQDASFLLDGERVVYTRATGAVRHFANTDQIEHSDIVVRETDGNNPHVLIRSSPYQGDFLSPIFSPDGSQLVYVRANSPIAKPAFRHALFVASSDGATQRRITPWSLDAGDGPDWSPNGKLILFRSHESGDKQSQIYVVRPDGTGLRALIRFKSGTIVLSSSFSPDGKWITFAKTGKGGEPDVFVMHLNGTGIRAVTRSSLWDSAPDWGSAG